MIGEKLGSFPIESVPGTGAKGRGLCGTTRRRAVRRREGRQLRDREAGQGLDRFRRESEILQQLPTPQHRRFLALGRFQGTAYFSMSLSRAIT